MPGFGGVFSTYVCQNLEGQLTKYRKLNHVVDFETEKNTKLYYNTMNYIKMTGDIDDESGDVNTVFGFMGWNAEKINHPHPATLLQVDPTIGSRMFSAPILIRREDPGADDPPALVDPTYCYLDISHIDSEGVNFVSYDSIANTIILEFRDVSIDEEDPNGFTNKELVIAMQIPVDEDTTGKKTMLGGIQVKFDNDVIEIVGRTGDESCLDLVNNTITIELNDIPTPEEISNFPKIRIIAPKNQIMYILPLGTVRDGVDSCKFKAKEVPASMLTKHWNYMQPDTDFTTEPKYALCPSMKCEFPSDMDIVKFLVLMTRDKIISDGSSGFTIDPYSYEE